MSWVRDTNLDQAGHRGWSMHCDHPGCNAVSGDDTHGWGRQLTESGWNIHWCPDHRPKETP